MADDSAQDKTLPASPRKLRKAREEGQVARSRDLGHFTVVAAGGVLVVAFAPQLIGWMQRLLSEGLRFDAASVAEPSFMLERLADLALRLLLVVVPLGLVIAGAAVATCLLIGGWNFSLKPLMPKFGKLNPISGFTQLFSKQHLIDAAKGTFLALVLGGIGALYLRSHMDAFSGVIAMPLPAALAQVGDTVLGGLMLLLLALALCAAIDAPLQKYLLANRLKMSHQEVKQEHKETEGNTEIKGRMKARMRELSRNRMLAAVPTADLVVMNPTHYAVALKYDDAKMAAPRVVAKGADLLAMTIRDAARGAEVPVLQAPVLARALYAHAEVDREIPAALFGAVAQVLAYVYQLRAAMKGQGAMPGELPVLNVPPELDPHNKPLH